MKNTTSQPAAPLFRVHLGYTPKGRNRWARFASLESANAFCERVRQKRGVILSIVSR